MKSKWARIIPVAFIMYMLAYMDRINIGVLMPYIQEDLNISSSASGDIAGIFFIGLLLQIPGLWFCSNRGTAKTRSILARRS